MLEETELSHPDGFVLSVETNYDPEWGCEWGYLVSLRRNDTNVQALLPEMLKNQGTDPASVVFLTPPKQLTSVYFNPRGVVDGSSQVREPQTEADAEKIQADPILENVRLSATRRILFLPHAVRQMSRLIE